eukprot:TRINITY_DN35190_c0_g1_i1.p3 TRINITY_DN35190_c0_g1~~TRINITY_DN35190_c0_g1_i1.p3  ORF type:complete len:164 (+),score=37.40 TRINITY_DN35190_c0_g1_i1:28-519(+)
MSVFIYLFFFVFFIFFFFFFFQAEDGIRDAQESRGLGDVYKRQHASSFPCERASKINRCAPTEFPTRLPAMEPYTSRSSSPSAAHASTTPARRAILPSSVSSGRTRLLFAKKNSPLSTPAAGRAGYSWNGSNRRSSSAPWRSPNAAWIRRLDGQAQYLSLIHI